MKTLVRNAYTNEDTDRLSGITQPNTSDFSDNDEDIHEFNSIEFCPAGVGTAQTIAKRIAADNGAALIIDYGNADTVSSSIRGIKDHQFVSALQEPGLIDLSADVDFEALKLATDIIPDVASSSIIGQGAFLKNMGVDYRMGTFNKCRRR